MTGEVLAERIAQSLRRAILRGDLRPGQPVKERDTAAEMGVSRTPMREAIRLLAQEGLLTLRPSRSPVVADPGLQDLADAVEVMTVLELQSAELACIRASDAELEAIRGIAERFERQREAGADLIDCFETDMRFHLAIVEASHNRQMAEMHHAFVARLWRTRYLSATRARSRARVVKEHRAIVTALLARDAKALTRAIDRHLAQIMVKVREHMSEDSAHQ